MADGWIGVVGTLLGTGLGSLGTWLITTKNLKRADDLARHRERQRDAAQNNRALLLVRYEKQRAATREYAKLFRADVTPQYDDAIHAMLVEQISEAFDAEELGIRSMQAAGDMLASGLDSENWKRVFGFLRAMQELTEETRALIKPPSVSDWHPLYQRTRTAVERDLRALAEELSKQRDDDEQAEE